MLNDKHSMYVWKCWCKASTCLTSFVNVNSTWLYHAYHSVKYINNVVLAKLCINNLEYIIGQTLRMVKINNKTHTHVISLKSLLASRYLLTKITLAMLKQYDQRWVMYSYVWFQVRTVESRTRRKSLSLSQTWDHTYRSSLCCSQCQESNMGPYI